MEDHVFQVGNTEIHPQMVDVTRCSISICLFTTACHARKKIRIKEDTQIPKVQSLIEAIGGRYLIYLPNLKIDMALLLYLALEIWTNMHNCIYQGEYYLPILCAWLSPQRRENLRVLKVVVWPHCNKLMKGDSIPVKQMSKLSMFFWLIAWSLRTQQPMLQSKIQRTVLTWPRSKLCLNLKLRTCQCWCGDSPVVSCSPILGIFRRWIRLIILFKSTNLNHKSTSNWIFKEHLSKYLH